MSVEKELRGISGWGMVIGSIVLTVVSVAGIISGIRDHSPAMAVPWMPGIVLTLPAMSGFAVVNPNEARLVTLFGCTRGRCGSPVFGG